MPNTNTLFEVCKYLKNWFDRNQKKHIGVIKISGGELENTYDLKSGQYYRIVGSVLNDGIYKHPFNTLNDEVFDGAIWEMAIPQAFLSLCDDIEAWKAKFNSLDTQDGRQAMSPFNSESFGGYSYSKSSGGSRDTTKDKSGTWQSVFGARLAPWRKI